MFNTSFAGSCVSASIATIAEQGYSPSFLLPVSFPAMIVDCTEYATACHYGYEAYFELMYDDDFVFVPRVYTWAEIVQTVVREIAGADAPGHHTPFVWRVGFMVGWLSALARTHWQDALAALEIVTALAL